MSTLSYIVYSVERRIVMTTQRYSETAHRQVGWPVPRDQTGTATPSNGAPAVRGRAGSIADPPVRNVGIVRRPGP